MHTGKWPKRVLVYRDGASDGSFGDILSKEVGAIRRAFYEIRSIADASFICPNHEKCQKRGCLFCTPRITFVVAQNEHNIRVVPAIPRRPPDARKPENVCSGTVVDTHIMGFRNGMDLSTDSSRETATPLSDGSSLHVFSSTRQDSSDFLLTAQGGLKGTSKPVYYRTLLNENGVYGVDGYAAATPLLKGMMEKITYHMAYQCELNLAWQLSATIVFATYIISSSSLNYRWYGYKGASEGTRDPLQ
jgi:hypothetical protein